MNADLEPRAVVVEQDGIFWWVYANGQKIARAASEAVARRLAAQFKEKGYIED